MRRGRHGSDQKVESQNQNQEPERRRNEAKLEKKLLVLAGPKVVLFGVVSED